MRDIIFYPNLKSDLHCVQASLKMLLKYYFPKKNFSYKELDNITKHKRDKWTWQFAMVLWLSKKGFEFINIENFDSKKFAKDGTAYLKRLWSDEVFSVQEAYSDFKQEQKLAKLAVKDKNITFIKRSATLKDLERYFKKDYFLMASVNPFVLRKQKGYGSHLVVVVDIGPKDIVFHDPGLPPLNARKLSKTLFAKAFDEMYAIKPQQKRLKK